MSTPPIDLSRLRTVRLADRNSKVSVADFARPWEQGDPFSRFLESLPDILAARDLKEVADRIGTAQSEGRPVILAMGAHPIKVGLSPLIIRWMERGILSALAMNGAGIIHDAEVAMAGRTSEDVEAELEEGRFGMAEETAVVINRAAERSARESAGLGESVGRTVLEGGFPHSDLSLTAAGARLGIPVTVHVAIGTDIVHMHPSFRADYTGEASHKDFRIFCRVVSGLERGVFLNLGSAVILPEVFLKALSLVRNLGYPVKRFTTVNMDFIRHYRPSVNVVQRPVRQGGKGFHLTGHHEIMFPLLCAAVAERLAHGKREP